MPSATPIVIADATPANHTFSPVRTTVESSLLVSREGTTSAGNPLVTIGLSMAHAQRATNKVALRLARPIEQTVDGVVSVRCTPRFEGNVTLPDDMTVDERNQFAVLIKNLWANAIVQGYMKDLDPLW